MFEEINKLCQNFREQKKKFTSEATTILIGSIKEFMNTYDVRMITWVQHTPYFCDGDPCEFEFGVNNPQILLYDAGYRKLDLDEEYSEETDSTIQNNFGYDEIGLDCHSYPAKIKADADALNKALTSDENEAVLEAAFGDHVRVFFERDKGNITTRTEDYEHD